MTDLSPSPSSLTMDTMTSSSSNLEKIESYFNTSSYRESLEISATFNSRLSMERRHRLPFLDPQTGVAQRHCNLYMKAKQRLPGLRSGQMYSFPATRWRKPKRQYLANMMTDIESVIAQQTQVIPSSSNNIIPTSVIGLGVTSGGFLVSAHDDNSNSNASFLLDKSTVQSDSGLVFDNADNSRDTNNNSSKEEILQRDWIYDDMENDFDTFSEPKSPDDEYDYDPRYGQKKRGRKPGKKEPKGKKGNSSTSAFGSFDFNSSTGTGTTTTKGTRGRAKDSGATSTPKKGESGTERRTRRKNAGTGGKKKFIEPPSFESAAAGFEDLSYGSASGAGWM